MPEKEVLGDAGRQSLQGVCRDQYSGVVVPGLLVGGGAPGPIGLSQVRQVAAVDHLAQGFDQSLQFIQRCVVLDPVCFV